MRHLFTFHGQIEQWISSTGRDEYGKPVYETKTITGVPCRFDKVLGRYAVDGQGRDVVIEGVLYLLPEEDISEGDRVVAVRDHSGVNILDITMEIVSVGKATNLDTFKYRKAYLKVVK